VGDGILEGRNNGIVKNAMVGNRESSDRRTLEQWKKRQ